MATRKKVKTVGTIRGNRVGIDTSSLDKDQRTSVARTRMADAKSKMKKKYDKREVTVGNKSKLQRGAQAISGVKGSKASNKADLYRSANKAQMELKKSEAIKAKDRAAKKKKEAAESKTPINYGTPMNYSMQPGSRETDSPGAFRDTPINKYMGSPVNYGTESPMSYDPDKKKAALEKARKAREEFQSKNPDAKLNVKTKQPVKPKTELKTTVKGDLSSGGYSDAQKKKAIAQMKADAAKKKKGIK